MVPSGSRFDVLHSEEGDVVIGTEKSFVFREKAAPTFEWRRKETKGHKHLNGKKEGNKGKK